MRKCWITGVSGCLDRHHVIPIENGGPDSEENIVYLDPGIHQRIHRSVSNVKLREQLLNEFTGDAKPKMNLLVAAIMSSKDRRKEFRGKVERPERKNKVTIQFTENEMLILEYLAKERGKQVSAFIKQIMKTVIDTVRG